MDKDPKYMWDDEYYSLWKYNVKDSVIDSYKYNFVLSMLQENLQHARHVENERITYHAFFAALVAGTLALIAGLCNTSELVNLFISICICFFLIVLSYITLQLCGRWSNAFERHLEYAKGCYYFLHKTLFGDRNSLSGSDTECKDLQEALKIEKYYDNAGKAESELKLHSMPLYCFRIRNPILSEDLENMFKKNAVRTKVLFRAFDHATIFVLRVVIFFLTYKFFCQLCESQSSIIPYLYNNGYRCVVYLLVSIGCAIVLKQLIEKIVIPWIMNRMKKKKGAIGDEGKHVKAKGFIILILLSAVLWIYMDAIMNAVNSLYMNKLELEFLKLDNFYKLALNASWAMVVATVCKDIAIFVERKVANHYNDDSVVNEGEGE